jgi:hypothetical protein
MSTPANYVIIFLVAVGLGSLTWGVGGLLGWDTPLIRSGDVVYMDARGAIGIGVGALAAAGTAIQLLKAHARAHVSGKSPTKPDDFR